MTYDEFDKLKVGDWVQKKNGMCGKVNAIHRLSYAVYFSDGVNKFFDCCEDLTIIDPPSTTTPTQPPSDHYKRLGLEPWDAMRHWLTPEEYRGYQKGTAIAYIARERLKGGDTDIGKAIAHLQKLLDTIEQQDQPEGTL